MKCGIRHCNLESTTYIVIYKWEIFYFNKHTPLGFKYYNPKNRLHNAHVTNTTHTHKHTKTWQDKNKYRQ